ncbi:MAG: FixH family protein [Beijerinckiaceae bacterium]
MPTVIPATNEAAKKDEGGFRLTGLHVLLMLVMFFGSVAAVNFVMIRSALSTFRGEVAGKPYEQGLAYNKEIAEARAQAARGWKVEGAVKRGPDGQAQVEVIAHDANGVALQGLQVTATLAAPADKRRDHTIKLDETAGGVYRGATATPAGTWDLELSAARDGAVQFQSRNRITLD